MSNLSALLDLDQLTVKLGAYRTGTTTALRDPKLLPLAKAMRKRSSQLMMPLDRDTAPMRMPPGRYFIQKKIDGEFTVLVFRDGAAISLNPYGTVRAGAPFHIEAAKLLAKAGIKNAVIGGELYVRRPDGSRTRVHDVCRIARAPDTQADIDSLAYAAFAIYDLDGEDLTAKPTEARAAIERILKGGTHTHAIETIDGDEKDVMARFKQWVVDGSEEGVVALSPDVGWFKIKLRHSIDVAVVGFSEGTEDRAAMLHSLLLAVVRDDGTFHVVGRTGGGFSDEQRRTMLQDFAKQTVDSEYIEVNSDRVAYRMLPPGPVAEISCLDIITASSEGLPIERMVIEWDADAKRWAGIRRLPLASIISPQFVRLRDDKQPTPEHVGMTQLTRIVEIENATTTAKEQRFDQSTMMRRAVATKELKGKTMVRKLLMWKTNKDEASPDYPAYVLLSTDYSPNRKTPLERDIRVSSSLEQIEAYWQQWQGEQFVKGWVVRS